MTPCAHCGIDLHSATERFSADGSLKSCPNCSANHGTLHVYLPLQAFGWSQERVTTGNPTGIQSWCRPCRNHHIAPEGVVCSDLDRHLLVSGPVPSAKARRAIEDRAMDVVQSHFAARGWDVRDVCRDGLGYDLHASRGAEALHIEVKGTQGPPTEIVVTAGEVDHARAHPDRAVLAIVWGIRLDEDERASGGELLEPLRPWRVDELGTLRATQYRYTLT